MKHRNTADAMQGEKTDCKLVKKADTQKTFTQPETNRKREVVAWLPVHADKTYVILNIIVGISFVVTKKNPLDSCKLCT